MTNASIRALVLVTSLASAPVLAQPLPEGDTGIASRYPDDVGIDADPDVVFVEDFEGVAGARLEAGPGWTNVWGALDVTTAAENVHAGAQALEVTATEPERSQGAQHDFADGGYDVVFARYYLKYHPDFPGMHHAGIDLFAGAPGVGQGDATGVRPDGVRSFQAILDTLSPMFDWDPASNRAPGMLEVYCYHMDQADLYGDIFFSTGEGRGNLDIFGSSFVPRPNVIPDRGRWYSFEVMAQANTPGSDDGRVAFWVDGALAGDFPSVRFRTVDTLKINQAIITTYVSELAANQTLWYDDMVFARSYIGPMSIEGGPRPDGGSPPRTDGGPTSGTDGGGVGRDASGDGGGIVDGGGGCGCEIVGVSEGATGRSALALALLPLLALRWRRRRG